MGEGGSFVSSSNNGQALDELGREKGTKPGWPVMSNGMECQNWRKGELEGSLSVFHEVLAQCTNPELFLH